MTKLKLKLKKKNLWTYSSSLYINYKRWQKQMTKKLLKLENEKGEY